MLIPNIHHLTDLARGFQYKEKGVGSISAMHFYFQPDLIWRKSGAISSRRCKHREKVRIILLLR